MSATLASVYPDVDVGDAPFRVDESSADESDGSAGSSDSPPVDWNYQREKEDDRLH